MRSLTTIILAMLVAFAGAGCKSGLISVRAVGDAATMPTGDGGTALGASDFFASRVEPMLATRCAGCHGPDRTGPDFLRANPDVRTTLLSYPALVDLASPGSSRLITKGEHAGPALGVGEAEVVRTWIDLEASEGTVVDPMARELSTEAVVIREGFNALALDGLGMPGTSLHFVATRVGGGMFLDSVQLSAGPTGVRLSHPVFVVWIEGAPIPDAIDRFAGMDLEVEPNSTAAFDGGTVVLTDLPADALLSIHFDVAEPLMGSEPMPGTDGGMPMPTETGCTELMAFRDTVSPALGTYCTRCHAGGNASATSAVDMTRVRSTDDAQLLLGCNQILGRISPDAPSASGLFTQPDPASASGHPFMFGTTRELDTFRMSILGWFEMEAP